MGEGKASGGSGRSWLVAATAVVAGLVGLSAAQSGASTSRAQLGATSSQARAGLAASEVENGRIAFGRPIADETGEIVSVEIFTINPDGSDEQQLTSGTSSFQPAWSPDGQRIVFVRQAGPPQPPDPQPPTQLWVMDADGTDQVAITPVGRYSSPDWSPDGSRIAFSGRPGTDPPGIYLMNADGSGVHQIHQGGSMPSWSADGSKLAFAQDVDAASQILVMNADGSGVTQLTFEFRFHGDPDWSPDGTQIAYLGNLEGDQASVIRVINADGTGDHRIHQNPPGGDTSSVAWSPDGTRFAFTTYLGPGGGAPFAYRLHTIKVDDSDQQQVVSHEQGADSAAWQPLPATALCMLTGDTVDISVPAGGSIVIGRSGSSFQVTGGGIADPSCGGATVHNVNTVNVGGSTGDEAITIDLANGPFAPGLSSEATGLPEIEFNLVLGAGGNTLAVLGSSSADTIRAGTLGVNANADDDRDWTLSALASLTLNGGLGNDKLSGEGGLATGSAYPSALALLGEIGNDTLTAGAANDTVDGGAGRDTLHALKTADGADTLTGGAGIDTSNYSKRLAAVTLDPGGGANDGTTGEGDNIGTDIENLTGGKGNDTLTALGTSANIAKGNEGNDTIDLRDGIPSNGDNADGGPGTDSCLADPSDTILNCP